MTSYDFSGKVAVITGAGMGMGAAAAERFARDGAAVVLGDVDADAVRAIAARIESAGGRAIAVRSDVTLESDAEDLVRRGVEAFGSIDMAFNAAGIQVPVTDHADEPLTQFDHVIDVNLRGTWAAMKHQLAQMRTQPRGGSIVNCSSLGGLVGNPGRAAYHASKFGVIGLTMSTALDYAARGVRVNAVCPGTIRTPMVEGMIASGDLDEDAASAGAPMGRMGTADEIASAVLWLASDESSYVTGIALPVDGGYVAQ